MQWKLLCCNVVKMKATIFALPQQMAVCQSIFSCSCSVSVRLALRVGHCCLELHHWITHSQSALRVASNHNLLLTHYRPWHFNSLYLNSTNKKTDWLLQYCCLLSPISPGCFTSTVPLQPLITVRCLSPFKIVFFQDVWSMDHYRADM